MKYTSEYINSISFPEYLELMAKELNDTNSFLQTESDPELEALAKEELEELKNKFQASEEKIRELLIPQDSFSHQISLSHSYFIAFNRWGKLRNLEVQRKKYKSSIGKDFDRSRYGFTEDYYSTSR